MGKVKTPRRAGAGAGTGTSSSPYDRPSASSKAASANAAAKNNVFKFQKTYGQHILKNPSISDAIVDRAALKPTDVVLEVGPGTGNLTTRILDKARRVIAVEIDPRMAAEVTKRVQSTPAAKRLDVLLGDVIKMADLPAFDVLISNTPYQISSPLVFKVLGMPSPPRTCVLMFQREFALRLTARAGDPLYGRLSVNAQFWARVTHVMKVGRNNFRPPPQVESSVVRLEPKLGAEKPQVSFDEFDGLLRVCFNRKNRTLHASFLGAREVLLMMERNYRVWCAMNDVPVDEGVVEGAEAEDDEDGMDVDDDDDDGGVVGQNGGEDEWEGIMDVDEGDGDGDDDDTPSFFKETRDAEKARQTTKTPSKRRKTKVADLVRKKIVKVLEETGYGDKRAGKLEENDFLKLLFAFNEENLHFA